MTKAPRPVPLYAVILEAAPVGDEEAAEPEAVREELALAPVAEAEVEAEADALAEAIREGESVRWLINYRWQKRWRWNVQREREKERGLVGIIADNRHCSHRNQNSRSTHQQHSSSLFVSFWYLFFHVNEIQF
jgi:hypothetical protein